MATPPPLPARSRPASAIFSSEPSQPFTNSGKSDSQLPVLNPPIPESVSGTYPNPTDYRYTDTLSSSSSSSHSLHAPASFINPIYSVRSPKKPAELSHLKNKEKTTNFYDSGQENSYANTLESFENYHSSAHRVERYVDSQIAFQSKGAHQEKPADHIYELCEVRDSTVSIPSGHESISDIFDLVSFKSPLYGSTLSSSSCSEMHFAQKDNFLEEREFYDVPGPLPPSFPPPQLLILPQEEVPPVPPRWKFLAIPPIPERTGAGREAVSCPNSQFSAFEGDPMISFKDSNFSCPLKEESLTQRPEKRASGLENEIMNIGIKTSLVDQYWKETHANQRDSTDSPACLMPGIQFCGYLHRIINHGKDIPKQWFSIESNKLCCYRDHKSGKIEEYIPINKIFAVTVVISFLPSYSELKLSELCCFNILLSNNYNILLGTPMPSERADWVKQLSLLVSKPLGDLVTPTSQGVRGCGYMHIKEGISGIWRVGFIAIQQRSLKIWLQDDSFKNIDLRKVSSVVRESSKLSCSTSNETGPVIRLSHPQQMLFLQGNWANYTETILEIIQQAWIMPPKAGLSDQYLTMENIPIIVDKCIKFISTHGTMLEGIYRLSGSSIKVRELLELFYQNPWNVHLKLEEYNPHDVSSVLKRYLRTLPDCLLTDELYLLWVETCRVVESERLKKFQQLLTHLPLIHLQTLKKLICHLKMISEHSSENRMPTINLAPVFGPTLLFRNSESEEVESYDSTSFASDVIHEFIRHCSSLFQVNPEELEKERQIQLAVKRMLESNKSLQKPAGDILIGVYIYNKEWGKCINVKINTTTTAFSVCEYAIQVAKVIKEPITKLALMEVICDGEMERPFHHSELVLPTTMRWMSWDNEEAKKCYLCIKHNSVYDSILPIITLHNGQALSMFGELLHADPSSKSLKKLNFEFTSAKLKCFKIPKVKFQSSHHLVGEWNIEDLVWYLGSDSKRTTPTKWTFTYIDKANTVKRSKSCPFIGSVVCCKNEEELYKWVSSMLMGQYPRGLVPTVTVPDLLS